MNNIVSNKKVFHVNLVKILFVFVILSCAPDNFAEPSTVSPVFADEKEITIHNYDMDAMEPFISRDGKYLFFNSLNDSINTSLYYAEKEKDTLFIFRGEVKGSNGNAPHLDAVPSMDNNNNFYFISTRNYPDKFENIQTGQFSKGTVSNVTPVEGDFYIRIPGWIIMDAEISRDGNTLYYVNARFAGGVLPIEAKLGIAEKTKNGFIKNHSAAAILKNVNHPDFLVYAPSISADGKELYFTRIKKGEPVSQICAAKRKNTDMPFGLPEVLNIEGSLTEAVSISADNSRLYYHKKSKQDDKYHIYVMERKP